MVDPTQVAGGTGVTFKTYETPKVVELGTVEEMTLSNIHKTSGTGDVIIIGNESIPVPGKQVTGVS
jgi:hypothetical protein